MKCCCVCQGVPTPPKKRRLTTDSMTSGCSTTLAVDISNVNRHTSIDEQFESRRRMLASRNLFEVSERESVSIVAVFPTYKQTEA